MHLRKFEGVLKYCHANDHPGHFDEQYLEIATLKGRPDSSRSRDLLDPAIRFCKMPTNVMTVLYCWLELLVVQAVHFESVHRFPGEARASTLHTEHGGDRNAADQCSDGERR